MGVRVTVLQFPGSSFFLFWRGNWELLYLLDRNLSRSPQPLKDNWVFRVVFRRVSAVSSPAESLPWWGLSAAAGSVITGVVSTLLGRRGERDCGLPKWDAAQWCLVDGCFDCTFCFWRDCPVLNGSLVTQINVRSLQNQTVRRNLHLGWRGGLYNAIFFCWLQGKEVWKTWKDCWGALTFFWRN